MKVRRKLIIIASILLFFLTMGLTISFAKIDPNNTYTLDVDKIKVKANDIITVTLKMKIPNKSTGIQSRISYDNNLTFLQEELTEEDFGNYGVFDVLSDPDLHAVAFAHQLNNNQYVTGDVTVIKLKFKVTGSESGPYKIAWQDYNAEGYFDIDTVTVERTDVTSSSVTKDNTENGIEIEDPINGEVQKEKNNYDDTSPKIENNSNTRISKSENTSKSKTVLPQTGDKSIIIAIVSGVLLLICIYIRAKKIKY